MLARLSTGVRASQEELSRFKIANNADQIIYRSTCITGGVLSV
jgi:hypothetical protein